MYKNKSLICKLNLQYKYISQQSFIFFNLISYNLRLILTLFLLYVKVHLIVSESYFESYKSLSKFPLKLKDIDFNIFLALNYTIP